MAKRTYSCILILSGLISISAALAAAQDSPQNEVIRVEVNLVQLNVAVTDSKGNYVTGLHPQDFAITEDKIPQKLAIFEEGNAAPQTVAEVVPQNTGSAAVQASPGNA